jgi:hypothetical protein
MMISSLPPLLVRSDRHFLGMHIHSPDATGYKLGAAKSAADYAKVKLICIGFHG